MSAPHKDHIITITFTDIKTNKNPMVEDIIEFYNENKWFFFVNVQVRKINKNTIEIYAPTAFQARTVYRFFGVPLNRHTFKIEQISCEPRLTNLR